jgi:tetratricopeptide (TPR) repeat protein
MTRTPRFTAPRRLAARALVPFLLALGAAAGCKGDDFKEGEGSKSVIESFVTVMNSGAQVPKGLLSPAGAKFLESRGVGDAGTLRAFLLSPAAKSCHFLDFAGKNATLDGGRIAREVKLRASGEVDHVDFEAIYGVRFELSRDAQAGWRVDRAETVTADLTLANTGVIFKIYYGMLSILAVLAVQGFVVLLRRRTIDPSQAIQAYRRMPNALGTMLGAFLTSVLWFALLFPQTFMSHFGFYWALVTISVVMRQLLVRYDYGNFLGQMPGARFLVWAMWVVPIFVFLGYQSKFKPEQTSAMSLSFDGPPVAETTRETALRADATESSEALETLPPGTTLGYLGTTSASTGKFLRVVHEQTTIGFVSAEAAAVKADPRTFKTEAEFTTELEGFFRAVGPRRTGVAARLADIGKVYFDDGVSHARRGSVRDHLEALARYREAFKYRDDDELRLAGAYSVLEIVRVMRRDNLLDAYGLAHAAAVSHNKTRALAAYVLQDLGSPGGEDSGAASERRALAALAHFFGDEDRGAAKQLPAPSAGDGRYLTRARALLEESPDAALALWDEIARTDPDDSLPFTQQGMRLLGAGNVERADAAFSRALGLGPENAEARVGAAAVLAARGRVADAQKALAETAQATSYNAEAVVLGWICAHGHHLLLALGLCLLIALSGPRVPFLSQTVVGVWLRILANGGIFAVVLLAVWYRLAVGHGDVGEPLRIVVHGALP